ncbi:hypothetical protein CF327_g4747 [Tilletia walkeri]|uniref:Arrestin-like N-terminal domain-containing protein n=1 Tax=Tilletia walkeri TaxID=117179 RepID=A0A8X7NAI2_9BASI|nr:hypothetical protein CF327_g4747 [Tilletia walkeri]KAE8269438.1 hypothetical protein A4X09_0g2916 [Tilletia walkeri]
MKLRLTTDASDLFLRPGSETNEIPLLTIHIHLDTGANPPSKIDKLSISVSSHETMAFPSGRYEQTELFNWKQEIGEAAGMTIQPNTMYTWQAIFRVSDETAEYHRSMYGRRYQKATVKLTAPGFLRPKTWTQVKNLFFVHHPLSDDAFTFSRSETAIAEGLGVVLAKASSAHLNVGGYLRVWLEMPNPAPEVEIQRFEVSLLQYVTLRSRTDLTAEETCPVERMPFLTVKGSDVTRTGHWIARLPTDGNCRPSSRLLLARGLIVTHAIEFSITYSPSEESSKSTPRYLRLRWPIELPSCALRYHSLRLPIYSKSDAAPVPERDRDDFLDNEHVSTEHCVCGQPLEVLLAIEAELSSAPQVDQDVTASIVLDEARHKFESGTRTPKTPT